MSVEHRSHALESVPNFRDVAERVPGLRRGVLYRSDLVFDPELREADTIRACGIRLVVDLRSPGERRLLPNGWFERTGTEIIAFNVSGRGDPARLASALASGAGGEGAHALMLEVYRLFPANAMPALGALGERIARGDLPLLVHCAAGKDRTGFIIAAVLAAVGIAPEHVAADYLASEGRVHMRTRDLTRTAMAGTLGNRLDDAALARINGVHAEYLHAAISVATQMYGSFDAYLRASGIDQARAAAMREQLLG